MPSLTFSRRRFKSHRRVRLWLAGALVALTSLTSAGAHADVIATPVVRSVRILPYLEGERSSVTTRTSAPERALFRIVNPRGAPLTVSITSLVLLDAAGNTSLSVTRVEANQRSANPLAISVPAHGEVRLTVSFSGIPASRAVGSRFVVRLAARVGGSVQRADAVISRTFRHPRRQ